jgi:hypothetical protein
MAPHTDVPPAQALRRHHRTGVRLTLVSIALLAVGAAMLGGAPPRAAAHPHAPTQAQAPLSLSHRDVATYSSHRDDPPYLFAAWSCFQFCVPFAFAMRGSFDVFPFQGPPPPNPSYFNQTYQFTGVPGAMGIPWSPFEWWNYSEIDAYDGNNHFAGYTARDSSSHNCAVSADYAYACGWNYPHIAVWDGNHLAKIYHFELAYPHDDRGSVPNHKYPYPYPGFCNPGYC